MAPATVAPSGGTLAGFGGVGVVGESVVRLNVGNILGSQEVCLASIPARKQMYRRQIGGGQMKRESVAPATAAGAAAKRYCV